jgi:hypothetical protein
MDGTANPDTDEQKEEAATYHPGETCNPTWITHPR